LYIIIKNSRWVVATLLQNNFPVFSNYWSVGGNTTWGSQRCHKNFAKSLRECSTQWFTRSRVLQCV
jgi:hypothetical protein